MNGTLTQNLIDFLPNLLGAFIILLIGCPAAWIIARLLRATLDKLGLDDRLQCYTEGEQPRPFNAAKHISQIAFWILIVSVFAGVFQALKLPVISAPLMNMIQTVFGYLPRFLAAVGLIVLAWILATSARMIIAEFLGRAKLDEKIGRELLSPPGAVTEKEMVGRVSLSRALGELAYWLVFLLFIPIVLDTLGLKGLLDPVLVMLSKVLAFLPNLFVATLILILGYFAAKIVSRVVINLLEAIGFNTLTASEEKTDEPERQNLAKFIGYVVFVLILVPIVIAALQALQLESITRPAEVMLGKFLTALPNLFAAAALLVIAYYVGRFLAEMTNGLLKSIGFDGLVKRMGLTSASKSADETPTRGHNPSWVIGQIVLVAVILLSAEAALRLIEFQGLANLLNQALVFLGHLTLGLAVFGLGLYLSGIAARLIRASELKNADILAPLAQYTIVILMGAMGLEQIGIGSFIIRLAFGLTLGAVAIAAAIAFGIGSRDLAHKVVTKYLGHWAEKDDSTK